MNNKVLIKLNVPDLNQTYDVFIPVNEMVWKIVKLIIKAVADLSGDSLDTTREYILINAETGRIYQNNEIIIDTEIRNSTELILLSCATNQFTANLEKEIPQVQTSSNDANKNPLNLLIPKIPK